VAFGWLQDLIRRLVNSQPTRTETGVQVVCRDDTGFTLAELVRGRIDPATDAAARKLVDAGLATEASMAQKLSMKLTIADLKDRLKVNGIKVSGNKSDLINRYIETCLQTATSDVSGIRLFTATDAGKIILEEYEEAKRIERQSMEVSSLDFLESGDVIRASHRIAIFEASQRHKRGIGVDWSSGMPSSIEEQASLLLKQQYADVPCDWPSRRRIGARLALSLLLGEKTSKAGDRLLDLFDGQFACPDLSTWLSGRPKTHMAAGVDPDDPKDLAYLYAHTKMSEASSHRERLDWGKLKASNVGKGIQIVVAEPNCCSECRKGKKKFRWTELSDVPVLPRHWGCRCLYVVWF
jgi:hypothetical protein